MDFFLRELKLFCSACAVVFFSDVSRPFLTYWLNVVIPFHLLIDFSVCPTGFHTAALVQHNCFAAFARTKNSLLRTLVYYSVCPFKSQGGNSQKIAYLRGFCGFPPLMHYCAKVFFLPIIISPDYFLTFSVFR